MENLTGEGNYTSTLNKALSAPPAGIVESLSALNIFLSITAAAGNALILVALKNVSFIHPPTKLFFRCLAVTDFCVGLIVQPLYGTQIIFRLTKMNVTVWYHVYKAVRGAISYTLCGVSLLTSTAISVDRLLALLLGLRYRHVVTVRRVRVVIACFWPFAISVGFFRVWKRDIAIAMGTVGLMLCPVTSIFCYTSIHLKLTHHQALVQNNVFHGQQNGEGIPLNVARYKKTVSSIMWVQLALVACYVPWAIVAGIYGNATQHSVIFIAASTLVYLNSTLNPILYCWKIREVRQTVKGIIRQLYCF